MKTVPLLSREQLALRAKRDLDYCLLLEMIAGHTRSAPGHRRLESREPATSVEEARASMQRTREALSLADEGLHIPVHEFPDVADLLMQIERSVVASGPELNALRRILEQTRELRLFATAQRISRPNLAQWLASDPALDKVLERLTLALEEDGQLSDRASPSLGRLRAKVQACREELVARLKKLIHVHADLLRDHYFAEREGRYVIPVRADAHRAIEGTVLDTSASGNTLFVEPRELTAYSNHLRVALMDVAHEEERVLAELSDLVRQWLGPLRVAENACVEADVLAALARYAHEAGARAIVPTETPEIVLRAMRHPLLLGRVDEVVANDLELRAGEGLIISGPNAGGKTVSLKAFGLFAMMAKAGLPMPASDESRVGYFDEIYSEIGDSQSLVSSLSTFSAHALTLASILAHAGPRSLVLLDEVAGGTDPEQGAALASAYLAELLDHGAAIAATTHYETLKEERNRDPRYRNAAVGFDTKTLLPSFRILLDVAGPSTALAVAERFGMPSRVIERAQSRIPEASRRRELLLEELTSERSSLLALKSQAERDAAEQQRLRHELEVERESAKADFQRQLEREYRELLGQIRVARQELDVLRKRLLSDIRSDSMLGRAELAAADRAIDVAAHAVALGSPVAETVRLAKQSGLETKPDLSSPMRVGARVFVPKIGMNAEIVEISRKGTVRVRAGSLTLTVSAEDAKLLRQATSGNSAASSSRSGSSRQRPTANEPARPARVTPMRLSHNTLDLRGERVDAALERVDVFVDELLRRSEPGGYVLHGHGTGALKQAVREHLRSLGCVSDSGPASPEDGGDAFTLVLLDS